MKCRLWMMLALCAILFAVSGVACATEASLTIWSPWALDVPQSASLMTLAQSFTEKTGIAVQISPQGQYDDKLQVALAANAIPDLLIMRGQFVDDFYTLLLPLSDKAFTPADCLKLKSVELFAFKDNRYYFWPYPNFSAALTLVNTEVFNDAGIDSTQLPEEIHELVPILRKIVVMEGDGRVTRYGLDVGTGLSAGAWLNNLIVEAGGQWAIDGKATLDSASAIEVMNFLIEQARSGVFNLLRSDLSAFVQGKSGLWLIPPSDALRVISSAPNFAFTAIMEPYWHEPKYVATASWGLAIPAHGASPEVAMQFVEFLNQPENHARLAALMGTVPFSQQAIRTPLYRQYLAQTPWMEPVARSMQYITSFADKIVEKTFFTDIRPNYTQKYLPAAVSGSISPLEFLLQVNQGTQAVLDRYK